MPVILVTGAGSVLGQSIFKALAMSSYRDQTEVWFTNSERVGAGFFLGGTSPTRAILKGGFVVPPATDPRYLLAIKELCERLAVDLVFGGTQHEIHRLAELRSEPGYERVASLPLSVVRITADKWYTAAFFERHGIAAPKTVLYSTAISPDPSLRFPVVVKPRSGSASRNVYIAATPHDLQSCRIGNTNDAIVQECVGTPQEEYTVGCYLDGPTKNISVIVMRRLLSRDGASLFGLVVEDNQITAYCRSIVDAMVREGMDMGPLNIQLRMHNGVPMCFEINGRFSSTEAPRAALGFNAVEAAVANFVYNKPYYGFAPRVGHGFVRYYEEVYFPGHALNSLTSVMGEGDTE